MNSIYEKIWKLEVSFKKFWKLGADFEKTSKLGGYRNLVAAGEAILKKKILINLAVVFKSLAYC